MRRSTSVALLLALASACERAFPDYQVETTVGRARVCDAGTFRCVGERLFECGDAGARWSLLEDCGEPGRCDSLLGLCIQCLPQQLRCEGPNLEYCSGTRWQALARCSQAEECNLLTGRCGPCTPGDLQCAGPAGRELMRCDEAGLFRTVESCMTAELCLESIAFASEAETAACVAPGCDEPGAYRCDEQTGTRLERCPASRVAWHEVAICASPELCQATASAPDLAESLAGDCAHPECEAGSFRCQAQTLERCNAGQTAWVAVESCEAPLTCDSVRGECTHGCEPGSRRCSGKHLEACNALGRWELVEECVSSALCPGDSTTAGARCREVTCQRAEYRCQGAVLERCDTTQSQFLLAETCESAALCNARDRRCDVRACSEAQLRCNPVDPRVLEECNGDLTAFEPLVRCPTGKFCNLNRAEPCTER